MEGNKSKVKTDYHDFDEYFSRSVIEATRRNPKQRIVFLLAISRSRNTKGKLLSRSCVTESVAKLFH